jgi:hypothetical protein
LIADAVAASADAVATDMRRVPIPVLTANSTLTASRQMRASQKVLGIETPRNAPKATASETLKGGRQFSVRKAQACVARATVDGDLLCPSPGQRQSRLAVEEVRPAPQ